VRLDRVDIRVPGGLECALPRMVQIEQRFTAERVQDIPGVVRREICRFASSSLRGSRIAVTVGSRGIASIREIIAAVVSVLRDLGASPFIVPAMGSHGGATAAGQVAVLSRYGVSEESLGVPIEASMDTVIAARLPDGTALHFARAAREADGIVVCGRIKPHTDFRGEYESGLYKMLAIGLGKHNGATVLHRYGFEEFPRLVPEAGRALLRAVPVLMGLAIVENGYHEVMVIEAIAPRDFDEREKALLALARRALARLRMHDIDVLIVDEIAKDVPRIERVFVRGLTRKTEGNACGIGFADLTTLRCAAEVDFDKTYTNAVTSTEIGGAKLPLVCNNDREALVLALRTCKKLETEQARVVWIKNTNELTHIRVSEAVLRDLREGSEVRVLSPPEPLVFGRDGSLL